MQQQLDDLKSQTKKLQKENNELRRANEDTLARANKAVEETTKVVARNSADQGQRVDKLENDMGAVQGKFANHEDRIVAMEGRVEGMTKSFDTFRASTDTAVEKLTNATTTSKAPPIPETADAVFTDAKKRYDAKQWNDARRLFDAFITRYGSDQRASQAQFFIGESYFAEAKYANAIGAYSKVIDNFPKSESVPDAMYKNGLAFYSLKYCGDARIYFQELLRRYPRTEWKKDAADQLKKLQKDLKNKDVCQS